MAKGKRPGVMLYFDLAPVIHALTVEQGGILLRAILEYAEFGVLPDFQNDSQLPIVWLCVQGKIDRDAASYEKKCEKNSYNQYKRWQQEKGLPIQSFDDWKRDQMYTNEYSGIRNIPTATQPNNNPTTASTATRGDNQRQFEVRRDECRSKLEQYRR